MTVKYFDRSKDRRSFLKTSGAVALVAVGGGTLAACGGAGAGGDTSVTPPATPTPPLAPPPPPPPIVATTNGTATLAPSRNSAQAVAADTWKNQLKIQVTPVGATRATLFELSNQGQRMDDFVRPGNLGNSAYYRVDLGFAIPGLWLALHYTPATPFDSQPHASYVFEHQPANRFRNETDSERLSYTAQVIDAALSVNVTTAIGDAAATADLKKLKHGQDQRWFLQSRPWPHAALTTTVPAAVTSGLIFDSVPFTSGGKSTSVESPSAAPDFTPLGSGGWNRQFTTTGGRNEIGPNGPSWVNKAIRTRDNADYLDAVKGCLPQFSVPLHAREANGAMAFWKAGIGPDGRNNAEKQIRNTYGGNANFIANYYSELDNGGWLLDTAHRGNGMFGIAAMQGGLSAADPLVIEEAVFFATSALNVSAAYDRGIWTEGGEGNGAPAGSVLGMGQGRDMAWGFRDLAAARSLTPTANVPNWLLTREEYDDVFDATLRVIEGVIATNDVRAIFGVPSVTRGTVSAGERPNTFSPVYYYTLFGTAFAYRATGNVRFKNLCQFFTERLLATPVLASPRRAFGKYFTVTYGAAAPYTAYTGWADFFARNNLTSTSAAAWDSFLQPDDSDTDDDWGDLNIAMFEAALIAKNLVGIASPQLNSLIALYENKWLDNAQASNPAKYTMTSQWAVKTTS